MKNLKLIVLLLFGTIISYLSYSQEEMAKVYLIRSTGYRGSPVANSIFIDNKVVCRLGNDKFSLQSVKPGEHVFTVQFMGKKPHKTTEPIMVKTEAGKTYYVEIILQSDHLICQEVTESSALTILKKCLEETKCL